jgi:hypothetical protein
MYITCAQVPPRCAASPQRLQERPGLLEVGGGKAWGEPAIDLGQQLGRVSALALALPQATQAQRRPQFPGLRLLLAGQRALVLKAGLGLLEPVARLPQELPFEPVEFGLAGPQCGRAP